MDNKEVEKQMEIINQIKNKIANRNYKYTIITMGCQLNENDSEKISGMVENMGYTRTDNVSESNLIIFNTCWVREKAEERLCGKLGEIKAYKEKNNAIIAIGGCMMQEKVMQDKIKNSYNFVDIVFGTHTLHKLPQDIYEILDGQKRVRDILDIDGEVYENLPIKRDDKHSASVTIMYGCNNFCTYGIVPYVRGRERSRKPENILQEIEGLAKEGYKEVTLLGQNVNSYMRSEREKGEVTSEIKSFAELLKAVNKIEGIERIRFISPHPKDFTDDVIQAIKECDKVCKIIHLPLQSGSSNVLKRMNRKYTKEQYLELAEKIKREIPNVEFSTDIIVGFPGETEEDFEDTLDVVRKINYEQIFMFIYSIRVGTPAEKMEDQVPETVKHERFERLKELYESRVEENNQKYIDTIQKVMVTGFSKNNGKTLTGRTETNKTVIFDGSEDLIGKIIDIKIISQHKWYLKGAIL